MAQKQNDDGTNLVVSIENEQEKGIDEGYECKLDNEQRERPEF